MIPAMSDLSDEETDNPVYADERDFYKVEKWTMDGLKVDSLLYAGNDLGKARDVFRKALEFHSISGIGRRCSLASP
jgi:hypothetical protein